MNNNTLGGSRGSTGPIIGINAFAHKRENLVPLILSNIRVIYANTKISFQLTSRLLSLNSQPDSYLSLLLFHTEAMLASPGISTPIENLLCNMGDTNYIIKLQTNLVEAIVKYYANKLKVGSETVLQIA